MSTVSWAAWIALRTRVRKSAMGSVIDMSRWSLGGSWLLPGGLRHPGDLAVVGELAQTDAAHPELLVNRARSSATVAASIGARLELWGPRLLDAHRCLGHQSVLSFSAAVSALSSASGASVCSATASGSV